MVIIAEYIIVIVSGPFLKFGTCLCLTQSPSSITVAALSIYRSHTVCCVLQIIYVAIYEYYWDSKRRNSTRSEEDTVNLKIKVKEYRYNHLTLLLFSAKCQPFILCLQKYVCRIIILHALLLNSFTLSAPSCLLVAS